MYKIGDFSSITKVSKRMLRYYDEKELLKPRKDELNNYRYYNDNDIETINKIKLLKKYNFSTDQIKEMIKMNRDDIKTAFKSKIIELNKKSSEYYNAIEEMNDYIEKNLINNALNNYNVYFSTKKSFYALCLRREVDNEGLEKLINELFNIIKKSNGSLLGKYFCIFHLINENQSTLYDVEVCQPILPTNNYSSAGIKFFDSTEYISTIHIGNYETLPYAYSTLHNYAISNNYILQGPYIETYYTDESITLDKNSFVTEVSICVKKI